jgi:hypothetical protein
VVEFSSVEYMTDANSSRLMGIPYILTAWPTNMNSIILKSLTLTATSCSSEKGTMGRYTACCQHPNAASLGTS